MKDSNIKDIEIGKSAIKTTDVIKTNDKNFEVFKEYNKVLLSFPNAPDPFLHHRREEYRKLQGGPASKTVFDRLTRIIKKTQTSFDNLNTTKPKNNRTSEIYMAASNK